MVTAHLSILEKHTLSSAFSTFLFFEAAWSSLLTVNRHGSHEEAGGAVGSCQFQLFLDSVYPLISLRLCFLSISWVPWTSWSPDFTILLHIIEVLQQQAADTRDKKWPAWGALGNEAGLGQTGTDGATFVYLDILKEIPFPFFVMRAAISWERKHPRRLEKLNKQMGSAGLSFPEWWYCSPPLEVLPHWLLNQELWASGAEGVPHITCPPFPQGIASLTAGKIPPSPRWLEGWR